MLPVTIDGKFLRAGRDRFLVKGVTYGTFAPDASGIQFPAQPIVRRDFAAMSAAGFNTVRVYTPPPLWLLAAAEAEGLRVIAGLPWSQHVAFLDDRELSAAIVRDTVAHVSELASHPAVLLFALGNEIPPSVVRWHGQRRIEGFLRKLCGAAREAAPRALFTYVNYPPTVFLDLSCFDVCAFNLYLHEEPALRAYLARLQNVAGHKPLLLAEAGADSIRQGDDGQAAITSRHVRAAFEEGACGAIAFAWTDEWWRGGFDVTDWQFGLVGRDRRPKPALAATARTFADAPFSREARDGWPSVSVVVCAFNAADTIDECLASLDALDYPAAELIVINDGSRDDTGARAHAWAAARADGRVRRVIDVPNGGLSRARNIGLEAATGEIVAYTDADVRVDPLWLAHLVQPFLRSDVVGSGGPNLVPGDDPAVAQCVARAPGGPTHVLLDDRVAEHVPGCNMAFRRSALLAIGGFDPIFLRAGDDVDVCWRLQARGWRIAFSPAALVWHRHRRRVKAYWRQQVGYGEGEAWLALKHPDKFVGGDMLWRGRIYSPLPFVRALYRDRLNTGSWGTAAFPSVYSSGASGVGILPLSAGWMVFSLFLVFAGGLLRLAFTDAGTAALVLGGVGIVATVVRCWTFAAAADFRDATPADRSLIALLHLLQPLARLNGRIRGRFAPPPNAADGAPATTRVRSLRTIGRALLLTAGVRLERRFWTETWTSLAALLDGLTSALRRQRGAGRVDVDEGWTQHWDVALPIVGFARLEAKGLVEEQARGACLVRTSARVRPTAGGIGAIAMLAGGIASAMMLERAGRTSDSLAIVLACAMAIGWMFHRIALASARLQAAFDEIAGRLALLPLGERPAWRPAFTAAIAGTLQALAVVATATFFVMTAAPTVWDAADDYFPAAHPAKVEVRPVSTVVLEPQVRAAAPKPPVAKVLKPGATSPRVLRARAPPAIGRRRT
jgi:cellulose synthase/poly-beta-1,6-N-acetylglucosamine synthase-like glycosyltransferase